MQLKLSFSSAAKLIVEVENRFASARRSKYEYNNSSLYIFGMLSNLILMTLHFLNTSSICQKIDAYQALRIHDSDINILHFFNTQKIDLQNFVQKKAPTFPSMPSKIRVNRHILLPVLFSSSLE